MRNMACGYSVQQCGDRVEAVIMISTFKLTWQMNAIGATRVWKTGKTCTDSPESCSCSGEARLASRLRLAGWRKVYGHVDGIQPCQGQLIYSIACTQTYQNGHYQAADQWLETWPTQQQRRQTNKIPGPAKSPGVTSYCLFRGSVHFLGGRPVSLRSTCLSCRFPSIRALV